MEFRIQTHVDENPDDEFYGTDIYNDYLNHLNDVHQEVVKRNPHGWEDEWEDRIDHLAREAGKRQGTHVEVEQNDDMAKIMVYSPYAARGFGKLPMSYRTPKEQQIRKAQEDLSHAQFKKAVQDRLYRGAKRMHEAGLQMDLFSDGAFTIDPDAEDPRDIYRPS